MMDMTDKELKALYASIGGRKGNYKRETLIQRIGVLQAEKGAIKPNAEVLDTPPASQEMGVGDEKDGTFNDVASLVERSVPPIIQHLRPISVLPAEPSNALPQTLGLVTPAIVHRTHIGSLSQEEIMKATEIHRAKGMTVKFVDNCWEFRRGERVDTGNMAMPLGQVVKQADLVCQAAISASRVLKNAQQP